ncbi:hypothetical protein P4200_14900 [Pseudomonas aeruginosa]|nr:hypothetical protein [Pseudomonas aeruginosa]
MSVQPEAENRVEVRALLDLIEHASTIGATGSDADLAGLTAVAIADTVSPRNG